MVLAVSPRGEMRFMTVIYANLPRFREQMANNPNKQHPRTPKLCLIYGGTEASTRQGVQLIPWMSIADQRW